MIAGHTIVGDKVNGQITWYIGYGDLSYTGNPYNGYMNPDEVITSPFQGK
jgi:hypothetical protein